MMFFGGCFFFPLGCWEESGNRPDESVLVVAVDLRALFLAGVKPELLQGPLQYLQWIYAAASMQGSFASLLPPPSPASVSKRLVWGRGELPLQAKHLRLRVKQSVVEALVLSSRA